MNPLAAQADKAVESTAELLMLMVKVVLPIVYVVPEIRCHAIVQGVGAALCLMAFIVVFNRLPYYNNSINAIRGALSLTGAGVLIGGVMIRLSDADSWPLYDIINREYLVLAFSVGCFMFGAVVINFRVFYVTSIAHKQSFTSPKWSSNVRCVKYLFHIRLFVQH